MAGWKSEHGALAKPPQMGVVAGYTEWASQFLWELHFIEAATSKGLIGDDYGSQFLWELHFIEAWLSRPRRPRPTRCSSFGNCTSLRLQPEPHHRWNPHRRSSFGNCTSLRRDGRARHRDVHWVAVPSGTALH